MGRVMPHTVADVMNQLHNTDAEVWETKREVEILKDKIRMLEEYLGIELVKTKEHYQEVKK